MDILNEAKKNFDYMVRIRRHMHEYPENSGVEYETVKYIASELDALGIEYVVVPEGGIIGQIHGGKPGKTVLLRADMDALPAKGMNPIGRAVRKNEGNSGCSFYPRCPYAADACKNGPVPEAELPDGRKVRCVLYA